jgi:hypothetical protein
VSFYKFHSKVSGVFAVPDSSNAQSSAGTPESCRICACHWMSPRKFRIEAFDDSLHDEETMNVTFTICENKHVIQFC